MATNRVLVQYPPEIIAEIDKIAGPGKRTSYLVELARRDVKLHRQREALRAAAGSWKTEDHPELSQGSAAYVRQIRDLDKERLEQIDAHRDATK
jgi:hypothetical protein